MSWTWLPGVRQSARYLSRYSPLLAGKPAYTRSRARMIWAASSDRRTGRPSSMAREVATSRSSGAKSSGVWFTLTPMPGIRYSRALLSLSRPSSVRMPTSFRPPRTMSLVHLIRGRTPQQAWMASHTATAAQAVKSATWAGSSRGRRRADR